LIQTIGCAQYPGWAGGSAQTNARTSAAASCTWVTEKVRQNVAYLANTRNRKTTMTNSSRVFWFTFFVAHVGDGRYQGLLSQCRDPAAAKLFSSGFPIFFGQKYLTGDKKYF